MIPDLASPDQRLKPQRDTIESILKNALREGDEAVDFQVAAIIFRDAIVKVLAK
jgi:hypothetical protein